MGQNKSPNATWANNSLNYRALKCEDFIKNFMIRRTSGYRRWFSTEVHVNCLQTSHVHVTSQVLESQCYFPKNWVDLILRVESLAKSSPPPHWIRVEIENRRYWIIHKDRVTIVRCKQRRKTVYDRALKLFSIRLHDALIVRCDDDDRRARNCCYSSAFLDLRY